MHDTTSTTERARRSVDDCSQWPHPHRPHRPHTGPTQRASRSACWFVLEVGDVPTQDSRRRTLTARPPRRRLVGESPSDASTPALGAAGPAAVLRPTRRRRGSTADGPSTYSLRVAARSTTIPSMVNRPDRAVASAKGQRDRGTTRTGELGRAVTDDGRRQRDTGTTCTQIHTIADHHISVHI